MYNLDDILHMDKYNNLSYNDLIDVVQMLKSELKFQMYRRDDNKTQLLSRINSLENELFINQELIEKYKNAIQNFNNIYHRKLTFKERLFGNIKIKKTES